MKEIHSALPHRRVTVGVLPVDHRPDGRQGAGGASWLPLEMACYFAGVSRDWTVEWEKAVGPDTYSWQVDRAIFDEVLLNNCRTQGAIVLEGAKVDQVLFQDARASGVNWRLAKGTSGSTKCDYVVDASGRAGVLAVQRFANREMDERYRNVATWGYWQGMETIPGGPQGAINVVSGPAGWYWLIPLSDGRTSVGYVTGRDAYRAHRSASASVEELYLRYVTESETLRRLTAGGQFAGTVHVEQDYSYCARSFSGAGYVLVGDAAALIDRLLNWCSSGNVQRLSGGCVSGISH